MLSINNNFKVKPQLSIAAKTKTKTGLKPTYHKELDRKCKKKYIYQTFLVQDKI